MGPRTRLVASVATLTLVLAACADGSGGDATAATADHAEADEQVSVVVTTAVLGSLVGEVVGDAAIDVEVIMDAGADPHTYALSARDARRLADADLVVSNGLRLETALLDALDAAEEAGTEVLHLAESADPVEYASVGHGHDDEQHATDGGHGGDEVDEGDEGDGDAHEHEGDLDPHVWLDPVRVARMVEELGAALSRVAPDHAESIDTSTDDVASRYAALDEEIAGLLASVPDDRRRIVTNHDSFGYFADRYDLEIVGTVLPGSTTQAEPSAEGVAELIELVEGEDVAAILSEASASDRVARTVATEVGGVELVEVYSGSLGEPGSGADTLEGMLRTNAERLAAALG